MKRLMIIIGALIMCDAYGEDVFWLTTTDGTYNTTSCTVGGNITKPADPSKSGYRFMGWKEASVEEIAYINGTSTTSRSPTWTVTFPYGTITGTFRCSSTSSAIYHQPGTPSTSIGTNCWCKLTNAGPLSSKISATSNWVFATEKSTCSSGGCMSECIYRTKNYYSFRRPLFISGT